MSNSNNRAHKPSVLRFGEIARKLGYITADDLLDALDDQRHRVERGESHRLLGLILLEMGHIDNQQLIDILRQFEADEKQHRAIPA